LQLFQYGKDDRQKLHDDGCVDIGVDTKCQDGKIDQRSSGKYIKKS